MNLEYMNMRLDFCELGMVINYLSFMGVPKKGSMIRVLSLFGKVGVAQP